MQGLNEKIFGKRDKTVLFSFTVIPLPLPKILRSVLSGGITLEQFFNSNPAIKKAFDEAEEEVINVYQNIDNYEVIDTFIYVLDRNLQEIKIPDQKRLDLMQASLKYMASQLPEEERKDAAKHYAKILEDLLEQGPADLGEVLSLITTAIIYDDTNPEYYITRATYEMNVDPKLAKEDFEKAIALDPQNQDYQLAYKAFLIENQDRLGIRNLVESVYNEFINKLASIIDSLKQTRLPFTQTERDLQADDFARRAYDKLRKGYFQTSLAYYNNAITLNSKKAEYYYERALLRQNDLKDYSNAALDYINAMELDSENADFYMENSEQAINTSLITSEEVARYRKIVAVNIQQENFDGALLYLDKILELNPNDDQAYFDRATIKYEQNNLKEAFVDISKAININSRKAEYFILRSKIAQNVSGFEAALKDLDKAIELAPNNDAIYAIRAGVRYLMNNVIGAFKDIEKAIEINPENAYYYQDLATLRYEFNDPELALKEISKAIDLYSDDPEFYIFRAKLYFGFEKYDEMFADYDTAIRLNPEDAYYYQLKARAHAALGNDEEALELINKAINMNPQDMDSHVDRVMLREQMGDYVGMIEDCNTILDYNPMDSFAYYYRGIAKEALEDYVGALEDYNYSILIDPENPEGYFDRATLYEEMGDFDNALRDYDTAIKLDDENSFFYSARGGLKDLTGDIEGALQDAQKAIELDDINPEGYSLMAYIQHKTKDYQNALANIEKAIKLSSQNADFYITRANIKVALKDIKGAMQDFDKAIYLDEDSAALYYYLKANALYEINQPKKALQNLNKAISMDKEDISFYLLRSEIKIELKDYKGALIDANEAIKLSNKYDTNSDLGKAYMLRGISKENLGDLKGALKDLNLAISVEADIPQYYFHRGMIKAKSGDMEGAKADYSKAIELDPDNELYKQTLQNLTRENKAKKEEDYNNLMQGLKDDVFGKESSDKVMLSVLPAPKIVRQFLVGDVSLEQLLNRLPAIKGAFYKAEENTAKILADNDTPAAMQLFLLNLKDELALASVDAEKAGKLLKKVETYIQEELDLNASKVEAAKYADMAARIVLEKSYKGYAKAIEYYTKAIELDPTNPDYYLFRAEKYYYQNMKDEAKADYKKALSLATEDWELMKFAKGFFKEFEEPEAEIKVSWLDKIKAKRNYKKAVEAREKGNLQEALNYYNQAIKYNPTNAQYFYERGRVKLDLNQDYKGAFNDFTKAMALDNTNADFPYMRALAGYSFLEDKTTPIKDLALSIKLNPNAANIVVKKNLFESWAGKTYEEYISADEASKLENIEKAGKEVKSELLGKYNQNSTPLMMAVIPAVLPFVTIGRVFGKKIVNLLTNRAYLNKEKQALVSQLVDDAMEVLRGKSLLEYEIKQMLVNEVVAKIKLSPEFTEKEKLDLLSNFEDKETAESYAAKAQAAVSAGDQFAAIEYYNKAIQKNPNNPLYYWYRSGLRDLNGTLDDIEKAIDLDPENAELYFDKAYLIDRYKQDSTIEYYNEAIKRDPTNAKYYVARARLKYILAKTASEFKAAVADYDKAIKLDPTVADWYERRGYIKDRYLGDIYGALTDYNKAIELAPTQAKFFYARAKLKRHKFKQYEEAKKDYLKAIELNPTVSAYYQGIADSEFFDSNYDVSLDYYNMAIAVAPEKAEVYVERGLVKYRGLGDYNGAMEDYNKAIELDPENAEYYSKRAFLKEKHFLDYKGALADYNKAIELDPTNHEYYGRKAALLYYNLSDFFGALDALDLAIKYAPENLDYRLRRAGLKRYYLSDYKGALEDLEYVLQYKPDDADLYSVIGDLKLADLKEYKGALEAYNTAIELDPTVAEWYNKRGYIYDRYFSDYPAALSNYNTAIKLNPTEPLFYLNRGNLKFYSLNDKEGAFEDYTKAIEVAPTTARYYFERAKRHYLMHNIEAALKDIKMAIKYNPDQIGYQKAFERWAKDHNIDPDEIEAEEIFDDNLEENSKGLKNVLQGLKERIFGKKSSNKMFFLVVPLPPVLSKILVGDLTLEQLFNRTPAIKTAFDKAEEKTITDVKNIDSFETINIFCDNLYQELKLADVDDNRTEKLIEISRKYMRSQLPQEVRKEMGENLAAMAVMERIMGADYKTVMSYYNMAIELDPTNAEHYFERACTETSVSPKNAKADLEQAIKLDPEKADFYKEFLNSLLKNQKDYFSSTKSLLTKIKEKILAIILSVANQNKKAETSQEETSQSLSEEEIAENYAKMAYEKRTKGYLQTANAYYNEAILRDPNKANYFYERALLKHQDLENYSGAFDDYTAAMELDPENADFYTEQAANAIDINTLRAEEAEKYNSIINYKIKNGELEDALKYIDESLKINPNNADFHHLRARCLYHMKNIPEAFESINKAIEINPNKAEYYMSLSVIDQSFLDFYGALNALDKAISLKNDEGYFYFSRANIKYITGNIKEAMEDCKESIKYDSNNPEAYFLLSTIQTDYNLKDALESINKAIEIDPENPNYYAFRAAINFGLKNYDESIADYDLLINMDCDNYYPHYLKANALYRMERYEDALENAKKAFSLNQEDVKISILMADIYYELGNYKKSLKACDDAMALDSNIDYTYYRRALIKEKSNNLNDALEDINMAISKNYRNTEYFATRADIQIKLNNLSAALIDISYALSMNPENPKYYYIRGEIWERKGNIDDAKKDYTMANQLDPKNQVYSQAISRLSN